MLIEQIRKSPGSATNTTRAIDKELHKDITTLIREGVSAIAIGALAGVIFWSCVLGMSGNFGPGRDVVVGKVAEADHE